MPTGTVLLPVGSASLPDGSASNAAPGIVRVKSSAAAPSPHFLHALFDAATKEMLMWSFRLPQDFNATQSTGFPRLAVQWKMASATTGNVIFESRVAAITSGDATDADAKAFAAANTSSAQSVPATAGHVKESLLELVNRDSMAAGDWVVIYFARDAAHASDSATGDLELIAVSLEYTT